MQGILLIILVIIAVAMIALLLTASVNIDVTLKEGKPILREINLHQMKQFKRGQLTVYFSSEHRALADEIAEALHQSWHIAREKLGVDLGRWGVIVIVPKADEEVGGVRLQRRIWWLWNPIWPIITNPGLSSLSQADRDTFIAIYWGMPHEAMELKIFKKLYHDQRTRWVGDGLAEYVGYVITGKLAPGVRNNVLARRCRNVQVSLLDQGHKQYDLTKEFLVKRKGRGTKAPAQKPAEVTADPGYGVALAFWLQIAQKHGEGVIKTFWQRLSQKGFSNAREAARILSELTGEDIWAKLQSMDLNEVLRTLEQAAGAPSS